MITPMLCEEIPESLIRFDDVNLVAERKFNGIRVLIDTTNGLTVYNRRGIDYTGRLIEIESEAKKLPRGLILDGEITATKDGKEWLAGAQKRCSTSRLSRQQFLKHEIPVVYHVFDILMFDGQPLQGRSYRNRKDILLPLIDPTIFKNIQYVQMYDVKDAWDMANQYGWEGIIIKNIHSLYYEGSRTFDWIKVKIWKTDAFEVRGYLESDKRGIKSLALFKDNKYVGRCGQGMDETDLTNLAKFMIKTGEIDNDLDTEPVLLVSPFEVTIKYYGYADDGKLRNAILVGIGNFKYDEDTS